MLCNTMFVLDLSSPAALALLARVSERHGAALASAARLPERIFGLQSPFAPGLCFIGAEVVPGRVVPGSPPMDPLYLAGTGLDIEDALAGCLGECVERVSQVERPDERLHLRSWRDAKAEVPGSAADTVELLLAKADVGDAAIAWLDGRLLSSGESVLVPADWCLRRGSRSVLGIPGAAPSTGCAAGRTFATAAVSAVLELIERDAVAHWWIAGRRGRPLADDGPAAGVAGPLLARLRGEVTSRKSWLLDIGTELEVPCIAAVSVDPDGRGLACGFAARLTPEAAVRSAVLEMCQMELALALARSKRERQGEQALTAGDRRQLALGMQIPAQDCDLLYPEGSARTAPEAGVDDLDGLGARLRSHGIEVGLVDLSRPNFKLATVFAVAPGLQMLPSSLVSPRLAHAIGAHGGGARWTGGLSLF